MAQLIDGKGIAAQVNKETATAVAELEQKHGIQPALAVVLIGDDPASRVYVKMKEKRSREMGMRSLKYELPADTEQRVVLELIEKLNRDLQVNGILVQSPPPPQINEQEVVLKIDPGKDVDCFHPYNVGKMLLGDRDGFFPCTPWGVMTLLSRSGIDPAGQHVVIVGRSNIVGKPLMALLAQKASGANATVTVCHSRTRDIKEKCLQADILVAAIGQPEFITEDMVKTGAVVVDVGVNRVDDSSAERGYRLIGDVAFKQVEKKASWITPVPGGVGPMTIAMLLQNTLKACKNQNKLEENK